MKKVIQNLQAALDQEREKNAQLSQQLSQQQHLVENVRLEERLRYEELLTNQMVEIEELKQRLLELKKEKSELQKALAGRASKKRKSPPPPLEREQKRKALEQKKPLNLHEQAWETHFQQLVTYKAKHGHCNVSTVHGSSQERLLGNWVAKQRTYHKQTSQGRGRGLRSDRIRRLLELGFEFQLTKTPFLTWEQRLEQLKAYKQKHGHTNVSPTATKNAPAGLGHWVMKQRQMYKAKNQGADPKLYAILTPQRIQLLNDLGFQWTLRERGPPKDKKSAESQQSSEEEEDEQQQPLQPLHYRQPMQRHPMYASAAWF